MDPKEKKRLNVLKGQYKGLFTRQENYLKENATKASLEDLELRLKVVSEAMEKYRECVTELQLHDEETDEDADEERVLLLQAKMSRLIKILQSQESSTSDAGTKPPETYKSRLPTLEIPVYDGKDVTAYRPFMEMFEAMVHSDEKIPKIQKLCFLKKYLKGEPLQLIDSLPIIADSYISAMSLLKRRYENKALLVNNHVTNIFDLSTYKGTASQLRELVSKVRQNLTPLKSLEQPVEQWNGILAPIIFRKLDPYTVRLYHAERDTTEIPTVDSILVFLDKRAASLEASPTVNEKSYVKKSNVAFMSTNANTNNEKLCILCSHPHKLHKCSQFLAMSPKDRLHVITNHNLCKICLARHAKKCRYTFKCNECSAAHSTLIHVDGKPPQTEQQANDSNLSLHSCQSNNVQVVLPTAKVLVSDAKGNKFIARALLDSGSQVSFCTTELADKLNLPTFELNKTIATLGSGKKQDCKKGINLKIYSRFQNYNVNVTCSLIPQIAPTLPQSLIDINKFTIPKSISLADDEFNIPGNIQLLLAADIFFQIIQDGKVEGGPEDPVLINTRLGYVVSACNQTNFVSTNLAMHTVVISNSDLDNQVKQFWETEKVPEVFQEVMPEHEYSLKIFQESVTLQNNSFQVQLPLKVALQDVDSSNSFSIALQRLYNLQKRFSKDPTYYKLYKDFIQEYLQLGHAKIIDPVNCALLDRPLYFLPHHAVLRLDKETNKLRVVFDGSAKTKNNYSLNDMLCNGPVLQKTLFEIIILFRTFKYTIQCDIRHMYRNIFIHPEHRCLQNILWFDDNKTLQYLQLQTVTYGLTSSAFLATACLIELAKRYKTEFPLACNAILNSSYIDDIQAGSDTLQGAIQLKNELQTLMQKAGFQLHKYASNNIQILQDLPKEKICQGQKDFDQDTSIHKILGLSYDAVTDIFKVSGRVLLSKPQVPTKRTVLSTISRLFDPMGFVGPVMVKAKLFLQQLWQHNLDWDVPLPCDLQKVWDEFYSNLINMPDINIKRYINTAEAEEIELVGYCDASNDAYGCCIFVKVKINGKFHVHLLCSKSKVAPINCKLTIPKLELNGALMLAKLMSHVSSILNIERISLFCDNKSVLGWLDSSPIKLPAYIANRVKEICKLSSGIKWLYTPSLLNPADIISRGSNPLELVNNKLWNHGPDYLYETNDYNFYMSEIEKPFIDNDIYNSEEIVFIHTEKTIFPLLEKYSSLYKTMRVMALVIRFIKKCKKQDIKKGNFSVEELGLAKSHLIKCVQNHYFTEELTALKENKSYKSMLNSLTPFIDAEGVLRVGGRLHNANLSFSQKFPIILPKTCHFTRLIIREEHLKLMHGGLKIVLSNLSQNYYIINSTREIKSVLHKCTTCARQRATVAQQLMGSLPSDRVNPARPFEKVGLDYCGPFKIKQSTKRNTLISNSYVLVIVCFSTKAAHLEVVTDMTTDCFLSALKRFIARRGNPSDIFCDNASTFKGANNKLHQLYELYNSEAFQNNVINFTLQKGIQFHFIPKYSPNHGGLWEAAVKSAKNHLKRVSSFKIFTYEQFNTIIVEIESILNSRPLTPLSQDVTDFSVLTPGHFLIGCSLTSIPQPDLTSIPSNRLRFWRACEQVRQNFWKLWSNDYLSTLNKRTKWQKEFPNLKEGLLVLLKNANTPPLHWKMGRIARIFPGKDNRVRVVEVQTSDKKLHCRALSKIVVLPIEV